MSVQLHWIIAPAQAAHFRKMSLGQVRDVADLYSSRTFGPKQNAACECGKYVGREFIDRVCPNCFVKVCSDAARARRTRTGHIRLPWACPHPYSERILLDAFPVAPIWYRIDVAGVVTPLGTKYEDLVKYVAMLKQWRNVNSAAVEDLLHSSHTTHLVSMIRNIIGVPQDSVPDYVLALNDGSSLLPLFLRAVMEFDPGASSLALSCCLVLKTRGAR